MSKRLYPHRRLKYWLAYDIEDICDTFIDLGLHPQTVRNWIKTGLKTIDSNRPILVYGYDLILFLRSRNISNKNTTKFDQLFCMKCQDARFIFKNKISVKQNNFSIQVAGHCRECKTRMFQNYKLDDFSKLRKTFTLVEVLELDDNTHYPDKTHISTNEEPTSSEPTQWRLL
jgi:hypothetical protein